MPKSQTNLSKQGVIKGSRAPYAVKEIRESEEIKDHQEEKGRKEAHLSEHKGQQDISSFPQSLLIGLHSIP